MRLRRVIAVRAKLGDLIGVQAEEEHVLIAEALVHLDVRAVERADGDSAVHHELHAAGARSFLTGGRYLLGYLCCGHYSLGGGDAVVLDEVDLKLILADGVVVDVVCHAQQQLYDALCGLVARGGLRAEHEGARQELAVRVIVQLELRLAMLIAHSSWRLYSCRRLT